LFSIYDTRFRIKRKKGRYLYGFLAFEEKFASLPLARLTNLQDTACSTKHTQTTRKSDMFSLLKSFLFLLFLPWAYLQAAEQPSPELQKARQEQTFKALCEFYANFPEGKVCAYHNKMVSVGGNDRQPAYTCDLSGKTFQETIDFLNSCTVRNLKWERETDWRQEPDKEKDEQEIQALATWLKSQTRLSSLSIRTRRASRFPHFIPLMQAIALRPHLTNLTMLTTEVEDQLITDVCDALKGNNSLTSLRMDDCYTDVTHKSTSHLQKESAQKLTALVEQHPHLTHLQIGGLNKVTPLWVFDKEYKHTQSALNKNIYQQQKHHYETQCAGAVFWAAAQGKTCKKERREGKTAPLWKALTNGSLGSDYLNLIVDFLVGDRKDLGAQRSIKINPEMYKELDQNKGRLTRRINCNYIALLEACGAWNKNEQELAAPQLMQNFEILTKATDCSKLSFYHYNLDKNSLQFMPVLNQCPFITKLDIDISFSKVDPIFFEYLKNNKTIKKLKTRGFHQHNLDLLAEAIACNTSLTRLILEQEEVNASLIDSIRKHPALTSLDWSHYDLSFSPKQIELLIGKRSKLRVLSICHLTGEFGNFQPPVTSMTCIAEALEKNYTLTQLDIGFVDTHQLSIFTVIQNYLKRNREVNLAAKIQPLYRGYRTRKQFAQLKPTLEAQRALRKQLEGLKALLQEPASFYQQHPVPPDSNTDGTDNILEENSHDVASSGKLIATGTGIVMSMLAVSTSALIAKMKIKSRQQAKQRHEEWTHRVINDAIACSL
jgi:hypothetical protein